MVKLRAHGTDVLQPVDVTCFSLLKMQYEKPLTEFVHGTRGVWEPQRQYFGTLLEKHRTNDSSKKILHDVSGFQKTEYTPS